MGHKAILQGEISDDIPTSDDIKTIVLKLDVIHLFVKMVPALDYTRVTVSILTFTRRMFIK